jgi:hypothetical protein
MFVKYLHTVSASATMNSPSSSSSPPVIIIGSAALDLLASPGGGGGGSGGASSSDATKDDAFVFASPILIFPADANTGNGSNDEAARKVEKLFRCALDGAQRALSSSSSHLLAAAAGGSAAANNYLGAAHASHGEVVVHAWRTASRTVLLLAVSSQSEESEAADEEEEKFVARTFRAMGRELTRARMNPFGGNGGGLSDEERDDEGGRLERCRRALANACRV